MKIALVRGAFLNQYEGQMFYPIAKNHTLVAFCSQKPIHDEFPFSVIKLPSPMDIDFGPFSRFKMPILNRLFVDAQLLVGLEEKLNGFDIAHCSDTYFNFTHQCVVARRQGKIKKIVATIYENLPFNNETIWGRRKFKKEALENVDRFLAVTERSKQALILEGCNENKITVLSPGIDISRFKSGNRKNNLGKRLTILFVGRIEFYKGVFEIVYAARNLLSDKQLVSYDLKFVMIGDGSQKQAVKRLIDDLEMSNLFSLKTVPYGEIHKEYSQADIFVAPSRATRTYQEQFGTVLMEAQAAGLPIITTLSGSIPENVENAALLANPGDFYSLSEYLKKFIINQELRKEYSKRAMDHAKKFDSALIAKEIEKIYFETLNT